MNWFVENADKLHKLSYDDIDLQLKTKTEDSFNVSFLVSNFHMREEFIFSHSWSIPCKEVFDLIKKYSVGKTIYDPLCGTAYWCKLLQEEGFETKASDLFVGEDNKYRHNSTFIEIEKKDAIEVVAELDDCINLLLSWPPYDESLGYDIVKGLPDNSIVFYVGEGYGGCCGNDDMFVCFEKEYDLIDEFRLPQFMGLHDYFQVYKKKKNVNLLNLKRKINLED